MKSVYLTIDDSPSLQFKKKMEYLYSKNIPAVFFCIGNLMEQNFPVLVEAIHKGFYIANHSYTHPAFSTIDLKQAKYEIEKTDELIEKLYQTANVLRPAKWFRFPYGDKGDLKRGFVFNRFKKSDKNRKETIQSYLRDLGYEQPAFEGVTYNFMRKHHLFSDIDWSWSFDVAEWALQEKKPTMGLNSEEKIIDRLNQKRPKDCRGFLGFEKRWISSTSEELLLLHDHEKTSSFFPKIIDELQKLPVQFLDFTSFLKN